MCWWRWVKEVDKGLHEDKSGRAKDEEKQSERDKQGGGWRRAQSPPSEPDGLDSVGGSCPETSVSWWTGNDPSGEGVRLSASI